MELPTIDKLTKEVAEKALDEIICKGKTLREWTEIIVKQQPCEDCISREWLKTAIHNFYNGLTHTPSEEDIQRYIEVAPSVTPQRPQGKWIIKDGREEGYDIAGIKTWYIQIMCNKCGFIKTAIEGHIGQYRYCPNCGAEMSGGGKMQLIIDVPDMDWSRVKNGSIATENLLNAVRVGTPFTESLQGKWIGGTICNKCNYTKMVLAKYNYCPNCSSYNGGGEDDA